MNKKTVVTIIATTVFFLVSGEHRPKAHPIIPRPPFTLPSLATLLKQVVMSHTPRYSQPQPPVDTPRQPALPEAPHNNTASEQHIYEGNGCIKVINPSNGSIEGTCPLLTVFFAPNFSTLDARQCHSGLAILPNECLRQQGRITDDLVRVVNLLREIDWPGGAAGNNMSITIEGFSSKDGDEDGNQSLSDRRAKHVYDLLKTSLAGRQNEDMRRWLNSLVRVCKGQGVRKDESDNNSARRVEVKLIVDGIDLINKVEEAKLALHHAR